MSHMGSPAPETGKVDVAFKFCQECSNLLYPQEDRATSKLLFVCKACQSVQEFDSACTYRQELGENVAETAGTTANVGSDPTLPHEQRFCRRCGETKDCVFFQSQQRKGDTAMKLFFVCTDCGYTFTEV